LEDSEPENVGLVIVGDGTDELLALVKEIVELPEEVFVLVDEVVVLDDGVVVLVDDDRATPRSERISESLASRVTKVGFT
jgi:superfamily I DNA and RNA helicase